ncbi:UDP-glucose dehydrogenase family protein [Bacillus sp. JJ1562]|uniref:UDP-glucose dehydrogenase family protein n=1 Tax=Bacillus sp. JJ1562 TaxID=3122960 RepID=UPI0030030871
MDICVIGVGYVGLTTSAVLAELGHFVVCVDKLKDKITALSNGDVPIFEPGLAELLYKNKSNLTFTTDMKSAIQKSEVIFIAVGTPSLQDGSTDMQYVHSVIEELAKYITSYKTIVTKSTVPPGTNNKIVKSLLQHEVNRSLFQVVSIPEFLREGSAVFDMLHPDRKIIGLEENDTKSLNIIKEMYSGIEAPYIVTSLNGAEIIKYASNAFLATKISFINEIATICDAFHVDIQNVAKGIGADTRIGNRFLQAGLGYGGSCFPKDLKSLKYEANQRGITTHLLDAVQEINSSLIEIYINKLHSRLPNPSSIKITVLGIAFKPNTDDIRHSQALELIHALAKLGYDVHAFDPIALIPAPIQSNITQSTQIEAALRDSDCVVVATEWDEFKSLDWWHVKSLMRGNIVLDGRNCLDKMYLNELGFMYLGVGRE